MKSKSLSRGKVVIRGDLGPYDTYKYSTPGYLSTKFFEYIPFNENSFIETDIQPAPTPGITKLEDCVDGCSSHPKCKGYVFANGNTCYYKSRDDIPLNSWPEAVSGSINTCYYTKIRQDGPK